MNKTILEAKIRKITGRKVKNLRKEGLIPANIYGKKIKSQAIQVKALDFKKAYEEAGETGLISLKIQDGKDKEKDRAVLVSNVQFNPLTDAVVHVDFRQVDLKEKVTANVPIELVGESPAEKGALARLFNILTRLRLRRCQEIFLKNLK